MTSPEAEFTRELEVFYAEVVSAIQFFYSWLTVLTLAAWYLVVTIAARKGQRLNLGVRAGGVAIVALSLVSLDLPYRLFAHNEFEAATWNGNDCYLIGERADDLLLFCPALQPPRNKVVQKNAENLHRLKLLPESIFTPFSPLAGRTQTDQPGVH